MAEEVTKAEEKVKAEKKAKALKAPLPEMSNFPNVSVVETPKEIRIAAEVPGLTRKDIGIGLNINTVTLSGKRKAIVGADKNKPLVAEVQHGRFNRTIKLPSDVEIRRSRVKARVRDGLLTLSLLKKDYKRVKSISAS
jgi:HSP20 family protein